MTLTPRTITTDGPYCHAGNAKRRPVAALPRMSGKPLPQVRHRLTGTIRSSKGELVDYEEESEFQPGREDKTAEDFAQEMEDEEAVRDVFEAWANTQPNPDTVTIGDWLEAEVEEEHRPGKAELRHFRRAYDLSRNWAAKHDPSHVAVMDERIRRIDDVLKRGDPDEMANLVFALVKEDDSLLREDD
jgi:hypothetical protein